MGCGARFLNPRSRGRARAGRYRVRYEGSGSTIHAYGRICKLRWLCRVISPHCLTARHGVGRTRGMGKASGVFNVPFRGDTWDPTVKVRGKKGPYFCIKSLIREMGAGIPPNLYCPEGAVRRPQTVGLKGV